LQQIPYCILHSIDMQRTHTFLIIILLVIAGCGENKQSTGDFITVDVTENYPKKELILQDFMDVEYIALETTDEFVNQGIVHAVGKEIMLIGNQSNSEFFIYDRTGKGLRKINRWGRGPEEYEGIADIILDEDNGELFIIDPFKGVLVYDLYGKFKRSFHSKEHSSLYNAYNYDNDNFICIKESFSGASSMNTVPFLIVSKHDGSINNEIHVPFTGKSAPVGIQVQIDNKGWMMSVMRAFHSPLIPYHSNWILTEASSDTVFTYLKNHSMRPFIVRTPSRLTMSHETLLFPGIITDRYCFMLVMKEDFAAKSPWPAIPNHPVMTATNLVYDKQERIIFAPTVYNDDFSDKRQISMFQKTADNSEIAFWLSIEANELMNDFKKGVLKGRLKEIAAALDEEDNPIIMLVKHKNP
jgi:hypothetical protein